MYLLCTKMGLDAGEGIRREGMIRLLGLERESVLYLNCSSVTNSQGLINEAWSVETDIPRQGLACGTRGIILGPEAFRNRSTERLLEFAVDGDIPAVILGARVAPGDPFPSLSPSKKGTIRHASVLDDNSVAYLRKWGVEARVFPDPILSARYPEMEKDFDLVLAYRYEDSSTDTFWRKFGRSRRWDISLVMVHTPKDYFHARHLFGGEIFFSSEPDLYKEVYARTKVLVTSRLDAAYPVLMTGGTVFLLRSSENRVPATALGALGESLVPTTSRELLRLSVFDPRPGEPMKTNLARLANDHANFWSETGFALAGEERAERAG